jgi:hypothetical protein
MRAGTEARHQQYLRSLRPFFKPFALTGIIKLVSFAQPQTFSIFLQVAGA